MTTNPRDNNSEGDQSTHVSAAPGSAIVVQLDKSVGRQLLLIIWVSAVVTALAVVGLFMAWQGFRYNIAHTNVLQYDLMDLRSKTGHAHENTPDP